MSGDQQSALAKLDAFMARLQELRDLAVAGVIDAELVYRASQDERGIACCWCGYDMTDHQDEPYAPGDAPIHHGYRGSGTKYVAWLLGVPGEHGPTFEHNHARTPDIEAICVLCRIEASNQETTPHAGR